MKETIRIKPDYKAAAKALKEIIPINGEPVAVKFIPDKDSLPEGVPHINEKMSHCRMVQAARERGEIFYATVDDHGCMGGSWALGLRDLTASLKTGEFYYKLGKFNSWPACKRTIDSIPHVESGTTYATAYAPLADTPFDPTIILITASPKSMLKIAQSVLYHTGGRIHSNFSGIQSICADTSAQVYLSGNVNFSLGCDGSRKLSGINEGEMVMGIPAEMLSQIIEALPIVTGAKGSS